MKCCNFHPFQRLLDQTAPNQSQVLLAPVQVQLIVDSRKWRRDSRVASRRARGYFGSALSNIASKWPARSLVQAKFKVSLQVRTFDPHNSTSELGCTFDSTISSGYCSWLEGLLLTVVLNQKSRSSSWMMLPKIVVPKLGHSPISELPIELVDEIVYLASPADQLSLSLVSHIFHSISIRIIYGTIYLSGQSLACTVKCCHTLSRNPIIAKAVKSFSITYG